MKINSLLTKYLSLNKVIKDNGGRIAIEGNGKLEKIYEDLLSLEDKILKQFGLPLLMKYREVLFELAETENPASKSEETIYFLIESATAYLNSTPEGKIELIENAKANNLQTYDILPEIGLEDGLYAMFIYEEVFKKGLENAESTISIIQNTEKEILEKLGQLNYCLSRNLDMAETKQIFENLSKKGVKYLKEFSDYRPIYPY